MGTTTQVTLQRLSLAIFERIQASNEDLPAGPDEAIRCVLSTASPVLGTADQLFEVSLTFEQSRDLWATLHIFIENIEPDVGDKTLNQEGKNLLTLDLHSLMAAERSSQPRPPSRWSLKALRR